MITIKTFLIGFLLTVALITGYIVRRQAGNRYKSDILEIAACITVGVIVWGILMFLSWII